MLNNSIRILRLIGLVAVVPFLIAHGSGEVPCLGDCGPPDSYILSGSEDPNSDIEIGTKLDVVIYGIPFVSPDSSAGGTIPPEIFAPEDSGPSYINPVVVNGPLPNSGPSNVGELWLHRSDGGRIKLLNSAISPSFLSIKVDVTKAGGFTGTQSTTIASTSVYTLAGGETGSEDLSIGDITEVFLNGVSIYQLNSGSGVNSFAPLMFLANSGDRLRIFARNTDNSDEDVTSIWLFAPDGEGVKLLHAGLEGSTSDPDGIFMDVTYFLP